MEFMGSHYAVIAPIRYYRATYHVKGRGDSLWAEQEPGGPQAFDLRRWKEPPHVAFANLPSDLRAALAFTRRYGVISNQYGGGVWQVRPSDLMRFGNYLRQAWKGDEKALHQMLVDIRTRLLIEPDAVRVEVSDLWTLVRLLFLQDKLAKRARVCGNPDCVTPYFLRRRKGQENCSLKCTNLLSVRRFRQDAAKQREEARKRGFDVRDNERIKKSVEDLITEFANQSKPREDWRDWLARRAKVSRDYLDLAFRVGGVTLTKRQREWAEERWPGTFAWFAIQGA